MAKKEITAQTRIQDSTVVLDVCFHMPILKRHERTKEVRTDGNQLWFTIGKKIMNSSAYGNMITTKMTARRWFQSRSLPGRILKDGCYLIPVARLEEVLEHLEQVEEKFNAQANAFSIEYDAAKEEAKEQLKDAFNEANYPSAKQMRRACYVESSLQELMVPGAGKVGSEISKAAMAKARSKAEEEAVYIVYELRKEFKAMVGHLAEQLEVSADGKRKQLAPTSVSKVAEWLNIFRDRNVLGDEELSKLADQAKWLLEGKTVEELRVDLKTRASLQEEMKRVTTAVDALLVDAPERAISFDD